MEKVILIDGNNLIFRSYYATAYNGNVMRNSKGFPTNALYGLANMLNKIVEEEKPTYIMVAFDKGKTFRHEKYADYKGGRAATPSELIEQFPLSRELCTAMGITYYEIDNYEADDIIGTFAEKCNNNKDYDALIISSDKDLLQLITDEVSVKLLKQTGYIMMDKKEFKNIYELDEPARMVDIKALMGDPSDNIPGVKGIGEKTAINLLKEYGTLNNLYQNIDSVKGKTKDKLVEDKQSAYDSYELATIYKEVPIDTDFEKIRYKGIDYEKYKKLLENLEFYSLIKKININNLNNNIETKIVDNEEMEYKIIDGIDEIDLSKPYAFYIEMLSYNYHKSKILGVSIYNEENNYYVPYELLKKNKDIFENNTEKYTYDLKKMIVLLSHEGIGINNCNYDLMIASYLLNYNIKDDISYLMNNNGVSISFYEEEFGTLAKLKEPDTDTVAKNACKKAKYIYDTYKDMVDEIEKNDCKYLFEKIEMPLSVVLSDMEITGIKTDVGYLEKMGKEIKEKLDSISLEIYDIAGCEFNISSPKQLADVLFNKMQLPYPKRVKDGNYSTNKDILDKLAPYNPIIDKIEEYRTLSKLYTSYIIGLIDEIYPDGRCHTIYNQTLTRTGRLSSQEPNLQNIPARLEYGKLIRKAFLPEENSIILSSDYSQIELRVFASMCKEKNLIEAFKEGKDIHAKTASDIFGVPIDEVTKEQRRQAKAVNFGILYGISSFGLSEDLNIDLFKAKDFIDNYLKTYPRISEYMKETIDATHKNGYVKTLMNRKRIIEELNNKNYMIRSSGERMALNTPIQGSSADILKMAMIEIDKVFERENIKSTMLLQVHDELIFNVINSEKNKVKEIVSNIMENIIQLRVPLKVDIEFGSDWYEAK